MQTVKLPSLIQSFTSLAIMAGLFLFSNEVQALEGGTLVSAQDPIEKQFVVIFNQKSFKFCTGTLIQKNIVITASHCIDDNLKNYLIVMGVDPYSPQAVRKKIQTVIAKKKFSDWPLEERRHDLALIKIESAFENSEPVPLAPDNWSHIKNLRYTAIGYGNTSNHPRMAKAELQWGQQSLADPVLLSGPQLPQKLGPGDSGGPALLKYGSKYYIIGVVSGRNLQTNETVHATILNSLDWIQKSLSTLNQSR